MTAATLHSETLRTLAQTPHIVEVRRIVREVNAERAQMAAERDLLADLLRDAERDLRRERALRLRAERELARARRANAPVL